MATLAVYNQNGEKVGDCEVDPASFAPRVSKQLLHDAVVMYLANRRQGSNKTKTRSEVAGTTKKMYRQKGTGNARAGSRRSPVRRGGGHANARQARSYAYRLNKKAVRLATRMAIASKIESGAVFVIDELSMESPKTKVIVGALKGMGLAGQTVSLATEFADSNVYRSGRNIAGVHVSPVDELNALTVLRPKNLVLTKAALERLQARVSA